MKYYKLIGVMTLLVFSFYLTDFITDLAINSNPLMQTIKNSSKNYACESVNATIENNTIIPGIKGKIVNEMESYLNMKDFGSFNTNYLIYDYIKPEISIEDYKDKIIISGNKSLRQISILIKDNKDIMKYLKDRNIKYSKLITSKDNIDYKENINIESNKQKFLDLDTLLKKRNIKKDICIVDYSNIEGCIEKKYYIVKPNIILKNSNITSSINLLDKGSIILVDDNTTLDNFLVFLNATSNKDLKYVYLSEIIKE